MYVTPSGPQSIGGVLDDAIHLFRHSFRRCWILALVPAVAFAAWQIAMARDIPGYGIPHFPLTKPLAPMHPLPGTMIGYMLLIFLFAGGMQGAVAARQAAVARGDDSFTLGRAFFTGLNRLPIFILSLILLYLALVGMVAVLAILVMLPAGLLLRHMHELSQPVASAGVSLLLCIPLLALMGRLQLFMVAVFVDRMGPLASLKASWRLTRGHWWRATAIMVTSFIMMMVLFLAVTVASDVEGYLTHFAAIHRFVVAPLLIIVSYIALYPLWAAIWVAMYNDFKLRRDGSDLAARVGALDRA